MGAIIPDYLYRYVYWGLVLLLLVITLNTKKYILNPEGRHVSLQKAWYLGLFFIIFFGTRPTSGIWMADTQGYAEEFRLIQKGIIKLEFDWLDTPEIIWDFIMNISILGFSVWVWFTVVAAIYIISNIKGIQRIFPQHVYIVFLFYTIFFLFYSGGINGIRNADAYSLVFLAISLYYRPTFKRYIAIIILCLIAWKIHTSVVVTILSFVIAKFLVKRTNLALIIWGGAIALSLALGNYLANIVAVFSGEAKAVKYLQYADNNSIMSGFSNTGFRWDFLLFSSLPIVFGWYLTERLKITDQFFQTLLNTYIIANAVWVVFIYAAFSNRFAMLSWCIYPYVMCYPFIKFRIWSYKTQNRRFVQLCWLMLLFTGYMVL